MKTMTLAIALLLMLPGALVFAQDAEEGAKEVVVEQTSSRIKRFGPMRVPGSEKRSDGPKADEMDQELELLLNEALEAEAPTT